MGRSAAGVAKAQSGVNSGCLKDASKGKVADFNACLPSDPKRKVARAEARSDAKRAKSCGPPVMPCFGYVADPNAVNQAQIDASIDLTTDAFGDPTAIADAKTDKTASRCQSAFQKDLAKGLDTVWREVLKAKKQALKGSKTSPAASGNADLVTHLRIALHASPKLAKALGKVVTDAGRKCPQADVSALFPGGCTGAQAAIVAACAQRQIVCRACEALNAADDTAIDCDDLMGALTNQGVSCL
jgi:hypothetical protein